ncbi:MAG: radical SAM protein [Candidatus Jordarchaeum sp.]|uniref:radical SAM protein n=1 Tax=Candidatus Jordarchaeum sp. TaxID=2823881 RepID=UPI004049A7E0
MQEEIPQTTRAKAELLENGAIFVKNVKELPFIADHSTAGPTTGQKSIFLRFNDEKLVRLALVETQSKTPYTFDVERKMIQRNGIDWFPAKQVKSLLHCPEQTFLNLDSNCIYHCKFCATPVIQSHVSHRILKPQIVTRTIKRVANQGLSAVALTTGVFTSPTQSVKHMCRVVKAIRKEFGDSLPIGVEPFVQEEKHVDMLYDAGADEIKVNVETYDPEIFAIVCSEFDYKNNLKMVRYAGKIFGENRACSNIIIGLGEKEEKVDQGAEALADWGIIASLRPINLSPLIESQLQQALNNRATRPSAQRLITHAIKHKEILKEKGLDVTKFRTMCLKCTGCDIVPQRDL